MIIDETADLADAIPKIVASKTFDNATSCSSENVLVIVGDIYDEFMREIHSAGGRMLDDDLPFIANEYHRFLAGDLEAR